MSAKRVWNIYSQCSIGGRPRAQNKIIMCDSSCTGEDDAPIDVDYAAALVKNVVVQCVLRGDKKEPQEDVGETILLPICVE